MKLIPLKRLFISLLFLLATLSDVSSARPFQQPPFRSMTIVIDPGHGGKFHGASGKYSREQDVALQVALRLGKAIEENLKDVKVIFTRTTDTEFGDLLSQDLKNRIDIANRAKADLFISIHCNSMPNNRYISGYTRNSKGKRVPVYKYESGSATKGTETLLAGFNRLGEQDVAIRENGLPDEGSKDDPEMFDPNDPESVILFEMTKNAFRKQSINLASLIQDQYVATGRINRGVKEQPLMVLQRAGMPAVLTEIGFISNPQEEDYINSEAGQNEIVTCILNAVQAYKRMLEAE